ncbi:zinc finger, CCHC-type containing protein, partial [Tanacetum coccineum]
MRIKESLREQQSDKDKGKEVVGPSMNMIKEGGKNKNKRKKRGFKDNKDGSGSNKKPKVACWKCGKSDHFKMDCRSGNKKDNTSTSGSGKGSKDYSQDQDRCWFKTHELMEDGSVLYTGDDHFAHVYGKESVVLEFNSGQSITSTLFNVLAVVRNSDSKRKFSGEKGIDCIFVGYAEHFKEYRFYAIVSSDSVSINTIIQSRDAISDENHFSSIPRPKDIILNSDE